MIISRYKALTTGKRDWLHCGLLFIAVVIAYANVYANEFILDDLVIIVQDKFLRGWDQLPDLLSSLSLRGSDLPGGFYRPVQMFIFFLIYQAAGLSEAAFHGTSVALHATTTSLAYVLGRRLGFNTQGVFCTVLVWALHPVHTEAVDYISGSADSLYSCFIIAGLLVLLPDFRPRRFWLAGFFFILALLSKESAVVFPALAVFTQFLVSDERREPKTYLRSWPLWLILAGYLATNHTILALAQEALAMHDPSDIDYEKSYTQNIFNRLLTSLSTLPSYLAMLFYPTDLHMERDWPVFTQLLSWRVILGGLIAFAGGWLIIRGKGRSGLACSWGLLWFAAAFSPYTGILKPINAFVSEHWLYLPSLGLSLGLSETAIQWIERQRSRSLRRGFTEIMLFSAVVFGSLTWQQNRVWHDAVSFYNHIFACGEKSGRAHNSLAQYYFNQRNFSEALKHFEIAAEHPAPAWGLQVATTHMHLAFIYIGAMPDENGIITLDEIKRVMRLTPRLQDAIREFEKTLEYDPQSYWTHLFLATLYDYTGDAEKAELNRETLKTLSPAH